MFNLSIVLLVICAAAGGFLAGWFVRQIFGQQRIAKATSYARELIEEAKAESESLKQEKLLEARDEIFQMRQAFENETKRRSNEIQRLEKTLASRELNLDRKVDILSKKEKELNRLTKEISHKEEYVRRRERELENLIQEENRKLERISGLTTEEAKRIQMQNMLERARAEVASEIEEMREEARKRAQRESQEIIMEAMQKASISHVVETTVSVIKLPDDEMKGRIIGREGRNIRAFESATGIEVIIDDTPKTVVLSGFDPLRREIARQAMEKLIYDGRIHPGRIEEVVAKAREEVDEKILDLGEQALHDLGLHGLHPELVRLLGKQHFRTSYGQNLLQHSKEVAVLAGHMAAQLHLDIRLAKRAGLLHDIGKTAEEYSDAPAHEIGVELAKKFGENEVVQNAIAIQAPHNQTRATSPISVLVKVADGISVSRPGAQKEMLENYIKRMQSLETVARSFTGVSNAYAIQAGRELRVIVEHTAVDDAKTKALANNIAAKLKDEMELPGQVKVTVIREYRSIDYAK